MKAAALESLDIRRQSASNKRFDKIRLNSDYTLAHLLLNKTDISYNLRRNRTFNAVKCKTDRLQNTFI